MIFCQHCFGNGFKKRNVLTLSAAIIVHLNTNFMSHSPEFLQLVDDAKNRIKEVSISETQERMQQGAKLIDVREDNEWQAGHAKNAVHLGRGIIERDIVEKFPDKNTELILYCGGGFRSALAADNLKKMGYSNVTSMAGGWREWKAANAPIE
jgi:rhodanese-related sulfurtransferase